VRQCSHSKDYDGDKKGRREKYALGRTSNRSWKSLPVLPRLDITLVSAYWTRKDTVVNMWCNVNKAKLAQQPNFLLSLLRPISPSLPEGVTRQREKFAS